MPESEEDRDSVIGLVERLLIVKRKMLSVECDIDVIVKILSKKYNLEIVLEPEPSYVK